MTLTDLQDQCAAVVNAKTKILGNLVFLNFNEPKVLDIKMYCSIGWVSAYLASRNLEMNTEEQYQEWASKALLFGSNNEKPACTWKMAKPDGPAVIAAWEAGVAKMM
ncbi:hypothetical protein CROQUDRAFT_92399 [Cronartium quercuum f. sp. fusiforme G11]|uniref:Uncharacterized protein n=1 Tax=Cronartium quercuum f. sp. fusiforme G11 TaxID=708437 RepID=A0A9P6NIP9_9BASI|nr:hypothetical protein CROQUDRAFT_92399 [Cronartium quercuum f. sp. fusiforme G11]